MENNKNQEEIRREGFNNLYALNVNDRTEKKNGLTYLTWAVAWAEFKKQYPSATYRIVKDANTDLPYFVDERLGIIVYTEVTVDGLTYEMWLPVMDGANKAMRLEPYTYQVWDKYKNNYIEKKVDAATMFDINKTIMRCLVKNLAMFGLGLYIYAGEDLPEDTNEEDNADETKQAATSRKTTRRIRSSQASDRYSGIRAALNATQATNELLSLYRQHQNEVDGNPEIKTMFSLRKKQLQTKKAA